MSLKVDPKESKFQMTAIAFMWIGFDKYESIIALMLLLWEYKKHLSVAQRKNKTIRVMCIHDKGVVFKPSCDYYPAYAIL